MYFSTTVPVCVPGNTSIPIRLLISYSQGKIDNKNIIISSNRNIIRVAFSILSESNMVGNAHPTWERERSNFINQNYVESVNRSGVFSFGCKRGREFADC